MPDRTRSNRGRRTRLTPRIRDAIVDNVEAGAYSDESARAAGIAVSTFHKWRNRGEKEMERLEKAEAAGQEAEVDPRERVYVEFVEHLTRARAVAEVRRIRRLDRIAEGGVVVQETVATRVTKEGEEVTETHRRFAPPDPRPDMFWLERTNRKRWGRHDRVEHSGPDGGQIPLAVQLTAREELQSKIEAAAERLSAVPGDVDSRARESDESEPPPVALVADPAMMDKLVGDVPEGPTPAKRRLGFLE